jgi:hypothetical protein
MFSIAKEPFYTNNSSLYVLTPPLNVLLLERDRFYKTYLNICLINIEDSAPISRGLHLYNNVNKEYTYKLQALQN